MKKLISVLLALLMITAVITAVPFTVSAVEAEENGDFSEEANSGVTGDCEWEVNEDGDLTIFGEGAMADYGYDDPAPWGDDIQRVFVEEGVTRIGSCAFSGSEDLFEVKLPDSLTSIGYGAFSGCISLESIMIPENVEEISPQTFCGCESLSEIKLPDCIQTIGEEAFKDCYCLENFMIPADCSEIGDKAFNCCPDLIRIKISQSVCDIGFHAFGYDYDDEEDDDVAVKGFTIYGYNDTAAQQYAEENGFVFEALGATSGTTGECTWAYDEETSTLTISGNGETGAYDDYIPAPWSDFYVNELIIEDGVTWIRSFNFSGLPFESVTIPDSVVQIGMMAFSYCENLKSVDFSENLKLIGGGAFRNCTSLESIKLPDSTESIGPFAFENCENLSEVFLPNSVTDMGAGVFENTHWLDDQPDGTVYAGKVLLGYKGKANEPIILEIEDGTVSVAAGAFSWMGDPEMITDIKFPSSLSLISVNSFWNCNSLTRVEIPATVSSILDGGIGYGFDEEIGRVVLNPNLVIVGEKGSAAEEYANGNGFTFEEKAAAHYKIGDVNNDGFIDVQDATLIQKSAVKKIDLDDEQIYAADVNDDTFIDVQDATMIQKYAVKKITEFPKKG